MKRIMWKITWNQRDSLIGIFVEQMVVIFVLMVCTVSLAATLKRYLAPGALETDDQFIVSCMPVNRNVSQEKVNKGVDFIRNELKSVPYVDGVSVNVQVTPYLRPSEYYTTDSVEINGKKQWAHLKWADKEALSMFNIRLKEGSWFTDDRQVLEDGTSPVIVSQQFLDNAIHEVGIGRKLTFKNKEYTIIGIVEGMKEGSFSLPLPTVVFSFGEVSNDFRECIVKVKKQHRKEFYAECLRIFNKVNDGNEMELVVGDIKIYRAATAINDKLPIAVQGLPVFFLFTFAFIGTFALFWIRSNKKAKEYALMIALGRTPDQMRRSVIAESVAVTLLAAVPSLVIAFFIYDLTWLHAIAIGATVLVMILFAVFSAWYPAYKVSRINPAEVLHYE